MREEGTPKRKRGDTETKTVFQTVSNEVKFKKCNYLHNAERVVQSIFLNVLITFKAQTLQLLF